MNQDAQYLLNRRKALGNLDDLIADDFKDFDANVQAQVSEKLSASSEPEKKKFDPFNFLNNAFSTADKGLQTYQNIRGRNQSGGQPMPSQPTSGMQQYLPYILSGAVVIGLVAVATNKNKDK